MEFKGTKGKWILTYPIVTSEEEDVCELFLHLEAYMDNKNAEQEKISKSNALLISKAPELLEALNWALIELSNLNSNYEQLSSISEQIECCRELIKKATEL